MKKKLIIWKMAFFLLLMLWVATSLLFLYSALDQGVTNTYMSEAYKDTKQDLARLAQLFPRQAYNKQDILHLLRQQNPEAFIVANRCTLQLRGLRFEFDAKGQLLHITTNAESEAEYVCAGL